MKMAYDPFSSLGKLAPNNSSWVAVTSPGGHDGPANQFPSWAALVRIDPNAVDIPSTPPPPLSKPPNTEGQ